MNREDTPDRIVAVPTTITRVDVVIPGTVREYWADSWTAHIQDEGRTLKLIAKGGGSVHKAERDRALANFISGTANTSGLIANILRGKAQLAEGRTPKTLDEINKGTDHAQGW